MALNMAEDPEFTTEELELIEKDSNDATNDPVESGIRLRKYESILRKMFSNHGGAIQRLYFSGEETYWGFLKSQVKDEWKPSESARLNDDQLIEVKLRYIPLKQVLELYSGLRGCINCIDDPKIKAIAFRRAYRLLSFAKIGVCKMTKSDNNAHQFALSKQAKVARRKKGSNPRQEAITTAIEAEQAAQPTLRPYKEALAMLGAVNGRLEAAGFAPVKVDVVRRRLQKRAALLKSAEK
jgi:hypothetical protein